MVVSMMSMNMPATNATATSHLYSILPKGMARLFPEGLMRGRPGRASPAQLRHRAAPPTLATCWRQCVGYAPERGAHRALAGGAAARQTVGWHWTASATIATP